MVVEAKGPLTYGPLGLQRLVADSPAFQRRLEVPNEFEAAKRIRLFEYGDSPVEFKKARPFASIWPLDDAEFNQVAGGSQIYLHGGGSLVLMFTDYDRHPSDMQSSGLDFAGWIDEVMLDVKKQAGVSDRLPIRNIRIHQSPAHSDPKDAPAAGDYWQCSFIVHWTP